MEVLARGNYIIKRVDGKRNLLDWQATWREGSLPAGWSINGVAAENSIVENTNPFATKAIMWKCTPNADSGPAGGFHTPSLILDNLHTYRYTTFVYREKASEGTIYHGCYNVDNLSGGANTNPYFCAIGLPAEKWYLLVGYIHPSTADTTWKLDSGGVYDLTGKRIATSPNDFKLRDPNVDIRLRNYLYYTDDPTNVAYFYNPRLEVCDGNEMSIEQLLQVSTREEIDAVKVEYKSEIQKLDNKIAFSVSEVKTYTDGKVTAEAQRASADATTKANAAQTAAIAAAAADATTKANAAQSAATAAAAADATNKANNAQNNAITALTKDFKYPVGRYLVTASKGLFLFATKIPEKRINMVCVNFDGYMYGNQNAFGVKLVFYTYTSLSNYGYIVTGADCVDRIRLGVKDGMVCIEMKFKQDVYYPGFIIDIAATMGTFPRSYSEGWTFTPDNISTGNLIDDTYTNVVVVPRKESFAETQSKAQFQILSDQIASKVSTESFNALGMRVSSAESTITQHSNQIASKVSQSTFDALGNRVTAAESSITQMPNKISLAVKEGVDSVQIGGRNLLLNSKVTKSSTSYHIGYWNSSRDFVVGETLTVTIKGDIQGSKLFGIWFNSGSLGAYSIYKVANGLYSRVITVPVGTTIRTIGIFLVGNQSGTDAWSFECIKLESGNKATDWTPAPEDVTADAQAKADAARVAAEAVAIAKANLAKTESQAYADGKVTAEERRAIADAQAKLNEAKADAQAKANAAQSAAATDATTKANAIKSNLQATGIDIENRLITVTADTFRIQDNQQNPIAVFSLNAAGKPILSANLIDANAIITNSLLAQKIAATDITTSRLTVSNGAQIGGWSVEGNSLVTRAENGAKLLVEVSGTKFLRINDLDTMLAIRSDGDRKTGLHISTYGNSEALSISANGYGYAIKSAGSHRMYQRSGEIWNTPGVLWAGRVSPNGGVQSYWGNGCTVTSANATATGFYDIYHDLRNTEYYVMVTPTPYAADGDRHMTAMICNKYSNYFTVLLVDVGGGYRRCAFELAIIGRNRYQ